MRKEGGKELKCLYVFAADDVRQAVYEFEGHRSGEGRWSGSGSGLIFRDGRAVDEGVFTSVNTLEIVSMNEELVFQLALMQDK
jgi:hypothetical protein